MTVLEKRFDEAQLLLGQLVEAMPDNEGAVSQLMRVQALCGQRGEALRTYRALATYLASEYDSTPMDEVRRLADAIRVGAISHDDLFTT